MPGPLILRIISGPQGLFLHENGMVAVISRYGLDEGTPVRVWVEDLARWIDAVVVDKRRTDYRTLTELVGISGYNSLDEWVRAAEKANGGSLPGWVFVLKKEDLFSRG